MPDPILPLADFSASKKSTLCGEDIIITPQRREAGSDKHHPHYFYVEHPASSGLHYQICTRRLLGFVGDGAQERQFSSYILGQFMSAISSKANPAHILKAISISSR